MHSQADCGFPASSPQEPPGPPLAPVPAARLALSSPLSAWGQPARLRASDRGEDPLPGSCYSPRNLRLLRLMLNVRGRAASKYLFSSRSWPASEPHSSGEDPRPSTAPAHSHHSSPRSPAVPFPVNQLHLPPKDRANRPVVLHPYREQRFRGLGTHFQSPAPTPFSPSTGVPSV